MKNVLKLPKIAIISGSIRADSAHMKLAKICFERTRLLTLGGKIPPPDVIQAHTISDLQMQIPLYNQDVESLGFPEPVKQLKKLIEESDGIIWLSPEFNGSITP